MIAGMPVQRIEDSIKIHGVQKIIYRLQNLIIEYIGEYIYIGWANNILSYLITILLGTAVSDVQRTAYEIILHIDDEKYIHWSDNLQIYIKNRFI